MNKDRIIKIAVVLSVLGHLIFLGSSHFLWLPGVSVAIEKTKKMFDIRSVEAQPARKPAGEVVRGYMQTLRFEGPLAGVEATASRVVGEEGIEAPKRSPADLEMQTVMGKLQERVTPKEDLGELKEKVEVSPRKVVTKDPEVEFDVFKPERVDIPEADAEAINVPVAFADRMFAFTPATAAPSPARDTLSRVVGKRQIAQGRFGALDPFVSLEVSTWKDPLDGQGYFQVVISPGEKAAHLESQKKEILFLIDSSLSIKESRIKEFKKGVVYCLRNLNEGDRFNIYTFKDDMERFSATSVEADPGIIGPAIRFMNRLEPSQRTDIYEAFLKTVRTAPSQTPSYIVLLSDGRPTQGETSSAKLIEEISRINSLERAIFAFSGGRRVNRYLLDFLSYQNRGWSEYAVRTKQIRSKISEFYDKIRDPLLVNLRFQFGQVDAREVYPKHLPDFYRNAKFTLFGKFRDEKRFSMRLVGEGGGKTKEIIFAGDLEKAEKGTREIARSWAFNKIYYLISRMTLEGPGKAAKREIQSLSDRFNLRTPYDFEEKIR